MYIHIFMLEAKQAVNPSMAGLIFTLKNKKIADRNEAITGLENNINWRWTRNRADIRDTGWWAGIQSFESKEN
jgi:hypothetical protein